MTKLNFQEILKKIKPSEKELNEEQSFVSGLVERIKKTEGKHVDVVLAGSLSRNTHLKGDRDIDLFLLFEKKLSRKEFEEEGLRLGKKIFKGNKWEKAYSEHPYIRGEINGFKVEIVPSYKIDSTEELQSSVDRTPFHTKYLQEKLKENQKDEVRLLRQFMKGTKTYGADLKSNSFPGYITELLILKYGAFLNALKEAGKWKRNTVIDLENHYPFIEDAKKKFDSHLIVVDPTDYSRNVAAALSFNQYARFVAAARAFLKNPGEKFFFGGKEKPMNLSKIKKLLSEEELVAVKMNYPSKALPDLIWGQLNRLSKRIEGAVKENNFQIFRESHWTDEKQIIIFLLSVENLVIQKIYKRVGPEVLAEVHSEKFLLSHKKPVSGPRIENGRWVLETFRKYFDARTLLKDELKKMKKESKKDMKRALISAKVVSEKDLIELYKKNKEFQKYFTQFLKGKEEFLEY